MCQIDQEDSNLRESSSSSKGPMAKAESQNFCIIALVASVPDPPLLPAFIHYEHRVMNYSAFMYLSKSQ